MPNIILSKLDHTWLIDIDGTIFKHNGYLIDKNDSILPGVKTFFESIPMNDLIIFLTSRSKKYKRETIKFLKKNNLRFNKIIFNCPYGERILLNDNKPSGLKTGHCILLNRNEGLKECSITIKEDI